MSACLVIDHHSILSKPECFDTLQKICISHILMVNICSLSKYRLKHFPEDVSFREEEARVYKFYDC